MSEQKPNPPKAPPMPSPQNSNTGSIPLSQGSSGGMPTPQATGVIMIFESLHQPIASEKANSK